MKQCTYCGKDYLDEASVCAIDEQPLREIAPAPSAPNSINSEPTSLEFTEKEKQGRLILAASLGIWFCFSLNLVVLFVARFGASLLFLHCIRLTLELGLFYAVWIGQVWARWLTVGLFALGFIFSSFAIVANPSPRPIILVVLTLFVIYDLAFSKKVDAFLRYQKARK